MANFFVVEHLKDMGGCTLYKPVDSTSFIDCTRAVFCLLTFFPDGRQNDETAMAKWVQKF